MAHHPPPPPHTPSRHPPCFSEDQALQPSLPTPHPPPHPTPPFQAEQEGPPSRERAFFLWSFQIGVLCFLLLRWAHFAYFHAAPPPPAMTPHSFQTSKPTKKLKYFCTLCNKIFMHHKGFFRVCVRLIIEETLSALSVKFNV